MPGSGWPLLALNLDSSAQAGRPSAINFTHNPEGKGGDMNIQAHNCVPCSECNRCQFCHDHYACVELKVLRLKVGLANHPAKVEK